MATIAVTVYLPADYVRLLDLAVQKQPHLKGRGSLIVQLVHDHIFKPWQAEQAQLREAARAEQARAREAALREAERAQRAQEKEAERAQRAQEKEAKRAQARKKPKPATHDEVIPGVNAPYSLSNAPYPFVVHSRWEDKDICLVYIGPEEVLKSEDFDELYENGLYQQIDIDALLDNSVATYNLDEDLADLGLACLKSRKRT